ncbi:MAG: helix-turn-helix domain-containing protein [bacterium]
MKYLDSLKKLGLEEKEQDIYLALLQLESAPAHRVATKTGLKRSTVYDILYRLVNDGFASEVLVHGTKTFIATPPEKLNYILENQKRNLEQDLPYLLSISNTKPLKPKVSYHYGILGIKSLYEDTLSSLTAGDEILAYVATDTVSELDDYVRDYVKRRAEKGISLRGIYQDSSELQKYLDKNDDELRISRLADHRLFPIKNEINIYSNKMIIITYKPEAFGILIESKEVADTQRAIFEMAWQGVERNKNS